MSESNNTQVTGTANTSSGSGAVSENTATTGSTGYRSRYSVPREDFGNKTGPWTQRWEDHPTKKGSDGVTPEKGLVFYDPTTGKGVEVRIGENAARQWQLESYESWILPN